MKKILVMLPVIPQKSYADSISRSLAFLNEKYQLDLMDPLDISDEIDIELYYQQCQAWLKNIIATYDAFLGFSFGGVILQQCFPIFEQENKPIVLFSTPTFADNDLKIKLGKVIQLCKEHQVNEALAVLDQYVIPPNKQPTHAFEIDNEEETVERMVFGLQRVLDTDSRVLLQKTKVDHLHLIGECSNLVNIKNVIAPRRGRLLSVPQAGMRVLQDNLIFCKQVVIESLNKRSIKNDF